MIHLLTFGDLQTILARLSDEDRISGSAERSELELGRLAKALVVIEKEASSSATGDTDVAVEAIVFVLAAVSSWRPIDGDDNYAFATAIAAELANRNGLMFNTADAEKQLASLVTGVAIESDATLDELRYWATSRLTQLSDDGDWVFLKVPSDDVRAFAASALTAVTNENLERLERRCNEAAEVLGKFGIATYQAIQHTHPVRHPDLAHGPQIHKIDLDQLVRSDLVVAFADRPSTGLGMILAYSERVQALQLIFINGPAGRSPLLRGALTDKEICEYEIDLDTDIRPIVENYIGRRLADLKRHRELRLSRPRRWDAFLELLRAGRDAVGREALTATLPGWLSAERVDEMLSSVDYFAGATLEEVDALMSVLSLGPLGMLKEDSSGGGELRMDWPRLTDKELAAAGDAARHEHWSVDDLIQVLRRATVERAKVGTRRLVLTDATDWIALAES